MNIPSVSQRGSSLLEIFVALLLLAIMALTVTRSSILGTVTIHRDELEALSLRIASNAQEKFSTANPGLLNSSHGYTQTVADGPNRFNVVATVEIDPNDRSRIVTVTTRSASDPSIAATIRNSYALWGNQ